MLEVSWRVERQTEIASQRKRHAQKERWLTFEWQPQKDSLASSYSFSCRCGKSLVPSRHFDFEALARTPYPYSAVQTDFLETKGRLGESLGENQKQVNSTHLWRTSILLLKNED